MHTASVLTSPTTVLPPNTPTQMGALSLLGFSMTEKQLSQLAPDAEETFKESLEFYARRLLTNSAHKILVPATSKDVWASPARLRRTLSPTIRRRLSFVDTRGSDRSIQRIKQRTKEEIGRRFGETLEEVIARLNPVLRGWSNYHTAVQPETKRLLRLNNYVRERLRIFLKRKYSDQSRGEWRVLDNLFARLGLFQFGRSLYLTSTGY